MILEHFDPPGDLSDFNDASRKQWSDFISDVVDGAVAGRTDHTNDAPRAQYYNLTKTETASDVQFQEVNWIAFPRVIKLSSVSDQQRWKRAENSRDVQDEYCEWSVTRRADGKITRATFTCEGPEYWDLLAQTQPDTVLELYQEFVDPAVQRDDLFDSSGTYIPRNKWNSTTVNGAMHLIQGANTLGAEIELSAAASIVRVNNGHELTGEQELIDCAEYGVAQRNSDPHIGGVVNSVARLKADLALSNPVGLYFKDLSTAGWATPDGSDPQSYWKYVRGSATNPVRAVYEVPSGKGFTVSDITIQGKPITFAAQITDFISIRLTAVACRFGQSTATSMACVGTLAQPLSLATIMSSTR
jgi:hypothetical protein